MQIDGEDASGERAASEKRKLLILMRDDAAANEDFQGAADLDAALDEGDQSEGKL